MKNVYLVDPITFLKTTISSEKAHKIAFKFKYTSWFTNIKDVKKFCKNQKIGKLVIIKGLIRPSIYEVICGEK